MGLLADYILESTGYLSAPIKDLTSYLSSPRENTDLPAVHPPSESTSLPAIHPPYRKNTSLLAIHLTWKIEIPL
jgi:hypothetical protein